MKKQLKKQYRIHPVLFGFTNICLFENGKEAGGYLIPCSSAKDIIKSLKERGYEEMKENEDAKI